MAERRPDRRVGRTKSRLKGALLELIDQRGYERVTIEQVAERADIGRSTFYSHYAPVWSGGGWTAETP
jgi:AcrR family transcriptional regulator